MQKENYSSFAIKISLALQAPAFCRLIMLRSLLLCASVYSSENYFCSQLTKINDGINIYWRSLCEQHGSSGEGWGLFPSGKATQQTGLRVICCGVYWWSWSISDTPFMKIAFSWIKIRMTFISLSGMTQAYWISPKRKQNINDKV